MRYARLVVAPALAVLLASTSASAAPPAHAQDRAAAKKLTADAEKAMKDKRWTDAVSALRKADKLDPTPARDVALGQALAAGGKLVEARKVLAPVTESPAKAGPAKKAREAAKKALADVSARLAGVKVTIQGPPGGQGSTLIDGIEVAGGDEISLNPGPHTVGATADGFEGAERDVTLASGAHVQVQLTLTSKAPPEPPAEAKAKPHGSRTPGVVVLALGGAGLVAGGIIGIVAMKAGSDARAQCHGTVCPAAAAVDIDHAKSFGKAANVAFLAGGALAATGLVLTIVAPGAPVMSDEAPRSARVSPWVGPQGAGVGVTGTF